MNADDPIKSVKITRTAVYIGDVELPGAIAEGGITVKPGGATNFNTLTIEFLVGPIEMVDPTAEDHL